jgi:tetratricopeptide (TPR) repeat protein
VKRRRHGILSTLPWLLALGIVGGVAYFLHMALAQTDLEIVDLADAIRVGDPDNGIPRDPRSALEYLDPLLARDPKNFQALLQAARAWADLRHFDQAVSFLKTAAKTSKTEAQQLAALRMAVTYLINENRYDEAIDYAQQVCDIQPDNAALPLQLGAAQYKGSLSAQRDVVREFVQADKGSAEIEIERRIEAFITDIWGEPEVEPLVNFLAAEADSTFRNTLRVNLIAARDRFLQASQSMADYRNFDGFDAGVAQAYTEMLLRSGRLFEAWIESALALRHDTNANANIVLKQEMLERQALCAIAIGEHGLAADRFESITDVWIAKTGNWAPPRYLSSLIEERLADEDWRWIIANNDRMSKLTDRDVYQRYAMAEALFRTGDLEQALVEIKDPYSLISLAAKMPRSVRANPDRRHAVLKVSYEIFAATSHLSTKANLDLAALDTLLMNFPEDLDARRDRIRIQREQSSFEGAMQDAFDLLTRDRRDAADFDLWLTCAGELSVQRQGLTLEERASSIISSENNLRQEAMLAAVQSYNVRKRTGRTEVLAPRDKESFPSQDPALAFTVVQERIQRNDLEQARNDARQLLHAQPQVQEFRYRLARLLVREGKLEAAVEDFLQLLADVPGDTEALDLALRVEIALGHDERAADLVNTMILQDPQGVGAVRYASQQLERQQPSQARRTLERIVGASNGIASLDVLLLMTRAHIAEGELEQATALVSVLTSLAHNSEDLALVVLELGLANDQSNLVDSAIQILRPLSAGLFPDQIKLLCDSLLQAELFEELMEAFPEEDRKLPAVRAALVPLAQAAKGLGLTDQVDSLLADADTLDSLRDRFLLLALDGRTADANRRLNLTTVPAEQSADLELCLTAGGALTGTHTLHDDVPTAYLRQLGLDAEFEPSRLELLDALIRILPSITRLESVRPAQVTTDPRGTYPHAGSDVERFLTAAQADPDAARLAGESLILMLLAGERSFWARESLFLAKHALSLVPGLLIASVRVAEAELDADNPREAIALLAEFFVQGDVDQHGIELFFKVTEAFGKEEWGLTAALTLAQKDDRIHLLLARTLVARGYPAAARTFYDGFLERNPDDLEALSGLIENLSILRIQRDMADTIQQALVAHPDNSDLKALCAGSLAGLIALQPKSISLMEQLAADAPHEYRLQSTLARAHSGDAELVEPIVRRMLDAMLTDPVALGSAEATARTRVLLDCATTSRKSGLLDLSRELHLLGMRLDPGNILLYRELAFLELDQGNLDLARRYLEVLSFVHKSDKDPPLALAQLLFEQIGQPHLAAEVIRATYSAFMPPSAVEILAAETFLRGRTEEALKLFNALRSNPNVTADTILNVGRMAFAARHDKVAKLMFDTFLTTAERDHPARKRTESLNEACKLTLAPANKQAPRESAALVAEDAEGPTLVRAKQ